MALLVTIIDLPLYTLIYGGVQILKYKKTNIPNRLFVTLFDIRKDYGQNNHSVKKIHLLDFLMQRFWGKFLKIPRSLSIFFFFQNKI